MSELTKGKKEALASLRAYMESKSVSIFSYSGPVYGPEVNSFIISAMERPRITKNISLFLSTPGGDAHAAYTLARFLQKTYQKIKILIAGPCKSAGTLVAVGAHELGFSPVGELGPLDVQISKKDELYSQISGLDTLQAMAIVQTHAFSAFEHYMLQTLGSSGGIISTRTACDVACQLVSGVFGPVASQIDPHRIGEVQRMMAIAKAYGERLGKHNLKPQALDRLINGYPSHDFIIDEDEARDLFHNVGSLSNEEWNALLLLEANGARMFTPSSDIVVLDVSTLVGGLKGGSDDEAAHGSARGAAALGSGEPDDAGASTPATPNLPGANRKSPKRRSRRDGTTENGATK